MGVATILATEAAAWLNRLNRLANEFGIPVQTLASKLA